MTHTHSRESLRIALRRGYYRLVERTGRWAETRGRGAAWIHEFIVFGIKQAWSCLFGGLMVTLLLGTHLWYPAHAPVYRYDALTVAAVLIQIAMLWLRLETIDEAGVILLFHLAGTAMEVFKTSVGSWEYPEPSLLHIARVPLFSGFMYASVGSYIARASRQFRLRFTHHPSWPVTWLLALGIYANFFLHHYWWDFRYVLLAATAIIFWRCRVFFHIDRVYRVMPLLFGFFLIAFFIWLAENFGTFSHAWLYPAQRQGWKMVSADKLGAWFLLTIMSYVMSTSINPPRAPD